MVSLKKTIAAGAVALGSIFALAGGAHAQYGAQVAVPTPGGAVPTTMVAYTTNDLNLRTGAGTGYPAIAVMPRGSAMNVAYCEASQNWCFGNWNGIQGWASARYLSTTPPYQPQYPQPYPQPYPAYPPQQVIIQPAPGPVIIQPGPRITPYYRGDGFGMWFYAR